MRSTVTSIGRWSLILGALALSAVSASSQDAAEDSSQVSSDSWCNEHASWSDSEHVTHCEVREVSLAAGRKPIVVDAGENGGRGDQAPDQGPQDPRRRTVRGSNAAAAQGMGAVDRVLPYLRSAKLESQASNE